MTKRRKLPTRGRVKPITVTVRGNELHVPDVSLGKGAHLIVWHLVAAPPLGHLGFEWCVQPPPSPFGRFTPLGPHWGAMTDLHRGGPTKKWPYRLFLIRGRRRTHSSRPCKLTGGGNPNIKNN